MRFDACVDFTFQTMFLQSPRPSARQSVRLSSGLPSRLLLAGVIAVASLTSACSIKGMPGGKITKSTEAEPVPGAAGVTQSEEKARLFGVLPIYRPDVQQGNFVSKEMIAQLRVGMTPEQVRFVLGTPLLTDAFHAGRWDYPFRIKDGKGRVTSSHVSVFFKDGRVSHFDGGELPDERDYLKRIAEPR